MRPIRIVLVGPGPLSQGGVSAAIATLMASPLSRRAEIRRVVTHRDGSARDKLLQALRGYAATVRALLGRRPDLVWIHHSADASFRRKSVVIALARAAGVPYVLHLHASGFDDYYRAAGAPERALVRWALRGARECITLGPTWKRVVDRISGGDAAVIPNPVAFPDDLDPAERIAGRIVFLGRYGDHKGVLRLVDALAQVADRHPEAHLVCAGDGDRDAVDAHAAARGIADRVTAHGWLGHEEGQQLLRTAAIFALPSRNEGLPVALLEAMAHGAAVVVSPVGAVPEVVDSGHNGHLVAADDVDALASTLDGLLADPDGARRIGRAARETIARSCSVPIVAERVEAVLDRAARHHAGGAL